ncbi:MAG: retroviral-like aspartic protease family protein [bacterium]
MKKTCVYILILISLVFCIADSSAFDIKITDDKFTLHADNVPLQDILQHISDMGINVRIDPQINPKISASFEDLDMQSSLKSILKSFDHILIWDAIKDLNDNSSSKMRFKLVEIQVFQSGRKDLMKPLEGLGEIGIFLNDKETKVIIKKDQVYIPVTLGYKGNEIKTFLAFDTGANSIVLHKQIADKLNITKYVKSKAKIADGTEIDTDISLLDYVKVGPYIKEDLLVSVIDYRGPPDSYYNGLLGMNFLRDFEYSIDFEREVIKWK